MQDRIVKIVPRLSEEKLIEELLATNDEMNTAFNRYQRYLRHSLRRVIVFIGKIKRKAIFQHGAHNDFILSSAGLNDE